MKWPKSDHCGIKSRRESLFCNEEEQGWVCSVWTCFSLFTSCSISISLVLALNSDSPLPFPGCSISSLNNCRYSSSRRRSSISCRQNSQSNNSNMFHINLFLSYLVTTVGNEVIFIEMIAWEECLTSCMDSFSFWNSWRFCQSLSIIFLYRSISSFSLKLVSSSLSVTLCFSCKIHKSGNSGWEKETLMFLWYM